MAVVGRDQEGNLVATRVEQRCLGSSVTGEAMQPCWPFKEQ